MSMCSIAIFRSDRRLKSHGVPSGLSVLRSKAPRPLTLRLRRVALASAVMPPRPYNSMNVASVGSIMEFTERTASSRSQPAPMSVSMTCPCSSLGLHGSPEPDAPGADGASWSKSPKRSATSSSSSKTSPEVSPPCTSLGTLTRLGPGGSAQPALSRSCCALARHCLSHMRLTSPLAPRSKLLAEAYSNHVLPSKVSCGS